MKQRVSLARAFLRDAPILLLDEPTKELDKENISLVTNIIRQISKDRLVIIVTHNLLDIECLSPRILQITRK
jgi:ATP-binding cassette subfamily B protein